MLFLRTALALSTLSSVLGSPLFEAGYPTSDKRTNKYEYVAYAKIKPDPKFEKLRVSASFTFKGGYGLPTKVTIKGLKGLKKDLSPDGSYLYHIHTNPIPEDGNCTKALAHLDPLNVTEGFICDPAFPQYCQEGDLSGKFGKINGTNSGKVKDMSYDAGRVRWYPEPYSILGRSVVIHFSNKTRIACGNIYSRLDGTADKSGKPNGKPSNYVKDYPSVAPVQPSPAVVPFTGTEYPGPDVIEALPYPWPEPARSISEAPNVKLDEITHEVKYNNTEQTITQPIEYK
ncbi:hypothetical protein FRC07_014259, partial [Ceratobasidium sp. 392]